MANPIRSIPGSPEHQYLIDNEQDNTKRTLTLYKKDPKICTLAAPILTSSDNPSTAASHSYTKLNLDLRSVAYVDLNSLNRDEKKNNSSGIH